MEGMSSFNLYSGAAPTLLRVTPKQAQTHLSAPTNPEGSIIACPTRRSAQGRKRVDRHTGLAKDSATLHPDRVMRGMTRATTSAGRLAPPAGGNRPRTPEAARRSSLSRSSLGCTEVQPREPKHSAIRRLRVPWLAWKNSITAAIRKLSSGKNFCEQFSWWRTIAAQIIPSSIHRHFRLLLRRDWKNQHGLVSCARNLIGFGRSRAIQA